MPAPLSPPFPVSVTVEADKAVEEMRPVWRFFGTSESLHLE